MDEEMYKEVRQMFWLKTFDSAVRSADCANAPHATARLAGEIADAACNELDKRMKPKPKTEPRGTKAT